MKPLVMLLVEDNPADVVFFREALADANLPARVEVVDNGEEALRFLYRRDGHADAPRPDVIILDLNIPLKNGQEVLVDMATDPSLNTIPVAVLTTSTSEACVCEFYPPGRCLYFTKTDNFGRLQEIIRKIAAHAALSSSGADPRSMP